MGVKQNILPVIEQFLTSNKSVILQNTTDGWPAGEQEDGRAATTGDEATADGERPAMDWLKKVTRERDLGFPIAWKRG